MQVSRRIMLSFPPSLTTKPVTYSLVKEYNLVFNILRAKINSQEGRLVIELTGDQADYERGTAFLREQGITLEPVSQEVIRNQSQCVSCGACVTHCPTGALSIHDRATMAVEFDKEQCIACGQCLSICPYHAMEVDF